MTDYTEHLISMAGGDGDGLDQIQRRADAATPGPWARPLNTRYRASVTADMPKGDPSSRWRDQVDHEGNAERVSIVSCPIWSDGKFFRKQSGRDLEFIAHARTDIPALLAMVREQQARIDRVEALASRWATLGASHAYYSKRVRHAVRKTP